ncbi:aldehyde dehydrogenase family protein [Streptococcus zalophi]|uniref:Aldehyde dehydrogenase family protein n=1 Tax=Streptococcus zalophi TaxID=640031 RepID=A0A934PAB7_9STRE|nr:aldehyde dehydrogenase family protein [Streptococcus zalophi]MBJ8350022.1 aldehyde dehydrogenase family protein [Streptococcus zalophi]MCR8967028.1 aldehyde dehydrogenase family protein [Streptococcus zalophi]
MENEVKDLIEKSKVALQEYIHCSQEEVDKFCYAISKAVYDNAELLAQEAVDETQMGVFEHKIIKNKGASSSIWHQMKDKPSVGIIERNEKENYFKVASPKGVIGCVTPTTNPSLSCIGNSLAALKGRNTVVISPHPRATKVSKHTVDIMNEALEKVGAPKNLIQIISEPSADKTVELMANVDVVVATGGAGIVRAAYSSGTPAYGVGQGNVQILVAEDYTDFNKVAENVVVSRYWDAGVQCVGDQAVIAPKQKIPELVKAFEKADAFYINDKATVNQFRDLLFENGTFSRHIVGKTALQIAEILHIDVPTTTKIFLLDLQDMPHGDKELLCGEKMCPVTVLLSYDNFEEGLQLAVDNLKYQGAGHSSVIYTNNKETIEKVGLTIPAGRILINQPGTSATGATLTNAIRSTSSIGCGSWGNNSISHNLVFEDLLDIAIVAGTFDTPAPTDEEIYQ